MRLQSRLNWRASEHKSRLPCSSGVVVDHLMRIGELQRRRNAKQRMQCTCRACSVRVGVSGGRLEKKGTACAVCMVFPISWCVGIAFGHSRSCLDVTTHDRIKKPVIEKNGFHGHDTCKMIKLPPFVIINNRTMLLTHYTNARF